MLGDTDFPNPNDGPSARIAGVSLGAYSTPPLESGEYLSLGDLTVLLGPNGAGKSAALRDLVERLPFTAQPSSPTAPTTGDRQRDTLTLDVSESDLSELLSARLRGFASGQTLYLDFPEGFPVDGWTIDESFALPDDWEDLPPLDAWLATLRSGPLAGSPGDRQLLFDALRASRTLVVQPSTLGWARAYWAIPRGDSPELREALRNCGLFETTFGDTVPPLLATSGGPWVAAPIGFVPGTLLPHAILVPDRGASVDATLRWALARLLYTARNPRYSGIEPLEPPTNGPARKVRDARLWLRQGDRPGLVEIHPLAHNLLAAAERAIASRLPSFVSKSVRVRLHLTPIADWHGGPDLWLSFEPPQTTGFEENVVIPHTLELGQDALERRDDRHPSYQIGSLASGHQMWVELAAIDVARALHDAVSAHLDSRAPSDSLLSDVPPTPHAAGLAEDAPVNRLHDIIESASRRRRLYVLDEPERHLHPSLARQAAAWLRDLSARPYAQVVIATHSPYFLRGGPDTRWAHLRPQSGTPEGGGEDPWRGSTLQPISPPAVTALSALAQELGFDHGELMTTSTLALFVEGEADRDVVRALLGPELHDAGVLVIPIHGAARAETKGLIDGEILMRYTSLPAALMLDATSAAEVDLLVADEAIRVAAARDRKVERRALARLLNQALETGHSLHPIPLPAPDIFDLLDERLLRRRFPGFPGHAAARAACRDKNWKGFYAAEYGIDLVRTPAVFSEIAGEMRSAGVAGEHPLVAALDQVLLLAAGG